MQVNFSLAKVVAIILGTLGSAFAGQTVVTDIPNWNHPTKAVLLSKGVAIRSVVLINKTKPIFYVQFPVTPGNCDTSALSQTLRELSKANGYWPYVIVDSSSKSTFLKAEVSGDPKKHLTTGINYQIRTPCFSESVAMKDFACSAGKLEVFDRSTKIDEFAYELRLQKTIAKIQSGAFSLDDLKEIKGTSAANASTFILATFSGPGMNCHEQYRVFQITPTGKINISDTFGFCSDIAEIKRNGKRLLIKVNSEMEGVKPSAYTWQDGKLVENKVAK